MQEKRPAHKSVPAPSIAILGEESIVFQVIADLIEEKIHPYKEIETVQGWLNENMFQFITKNKLESRPEALSQAYTILVFDPNDRASIDLMHGHLHELALHNKALKHIFILNVNFGQENIPVRNEIRSLAYSTTNTSYLEYSPRDIESIKNMRNTINKTVTAEAKQWYEWANYYISALSNDPDNKQLLFKALTCFAAVYRDSPQLVGYQFLVLLSNLTASGEKEIPELTEDIEANREAIREAMTVFQNRYPKYKNAMQVIILEQTQALANNRNLDEILLKQAAEKLTDYAHPGLFKMLGRKRHVKDIDNILSEIRVSKVKTIDGLIARLEEIPNKKRSLVRLIGEINKLANYDPQPASLKNNRK